MKLRLIFQLVAGLVLLSVTAGAVALLWITRPKPTLREIEEIRPAVEIVEVQPVALRLNVESQGTVQPSRQSRLSSEVAGRVVAVSERFAEGAFFQEGDELLRVEASTYETALATAEAEAAQARLVLEEEKARAGQARREWEELGGGEASPLVLRQLHLQRAEAALAAAEAAVGQARADLEKTRITAPYDCLIHQRRADLGDYLQPGREIAEVFAVHRVEVRLPVSPAEAAFLPGWVFGSLPSRDQEYPVLLQHEFGGRTWDWEGRLIRSEGRIDPRSRLAYLIVEVNDPYLTGNSETPPLAIGSFVRAWLPGRHVDEAFVLPRTALDGTDRVFVVDEQDRLRIRQVRVERSAGNQVIITDGLEPGDRVSITPLETRADGLAVRVAGERPAPGWEALR